ncbi:MAG: hypothetical protein K940chlam3_00724 [Chlamydiae bacterium]|nr:hypothetical protein [Chlamydiota bacterium]
MRKSRRRALQGSNMESSKSKLNKKIRFWAILGPFLTLLIFSVYLIKQSPSSLPLAIMALGGLICCWQWRMKGLLISLALITAMLLFNFSTVLMGERFWFLGLAMATALSFVVTVLSYEEIEVLLKSMQYRSKKHLDKITDLTTLHKKGLAEKEKLMIDFDWLKDQKKDLETQIHEKDCMINSLRSEVEKIPTLNNQLQETQHLAEKYQVKTPTQSQSHDNFEHLYQQLRYQFSEKGKLLDQTRKELFAAQEKVTCLKRDMEEMTKYSGDHYSLQLEKDYVTLTRDLESQNKMYVEEITELECLVGALLQRN